MKKILLLLAISFIAANIRGQVCAAPDTAQAMVLFFCSEGGAPLLPGEFSLSETTVAKFCSGNLMYQPSTRKWRIAKRQYDFVGGQWGETSKNNWPWRDKIPNLDHGTVKEMINGVLTKCSNAYKGDSTYQGWIDLFTWGSSGWYGADEDEDRTLLPIARHNPAYADDGKNHNPKKKITCAPYEFGVNNYFQLGGIQEQGLTGEYANADWGVYNNDSLGGDETHHFRTPTYEEFDYLINRRNNHLFLSARGTIIIPGPTSNHDTVINGLILLPDDWETIKPASVHIVTDGELPALNTWTYCIESNMYTPAEWALMEACGALFFPASGGYGTSNTNTAKYNRSGFYWTSQAKAKTWTAYNIQFGPKDVVSFKNEERGYSRAVRLCEVRTAE